MKGGKQLVDYLLSVRFVYLRYGHRRAEAALKFDYDNGAIGKGTWLLASAVLERLKDAGNGQEVGA